MRLQARLPEIQAARGRLAAVSVDAPADSANLIARLARLDPPTRVQFPLLSDPGGTLAKRLGVWDARHAIALPATVIVGSDGKVAWTHVAGTVFDRPEEGAIVQALRARGP